MFQSKVYSQKGDKCIKDIYQGATVFQSKTNVSRTFEIYRGGTMFQSKVFSQIGDKCIKDLRGWAMFESKTNVSRLDTSWRNEDFQDISKWN